MTRGVPSLRILILHTNEAVRELLLNTLRDNVEFPNLVVEQLDPQYLDHQTVLSLLARRYDYILFNLRLPFALLIRMTEVAHRARLQTRMVLVSGTPCQIGQAFPLFDEFVPIPCDLAEFGRLIRLDAEFPWRSRTQLPSAEHVDAAIQDMCRIIGYAFIGHSDRYQAYRQILPTTPDRAIQKLRCDVSLERRQSRLKMRTLADFRSRLNRATVRIQKCRSLDVDLKCLLIDQFKEVRSQLQPHVTEHPAESRELINTLEDVVRMVAPAEEYVGSEDVKNSLQQLLEDSRSLGMLTCNVQNVLKILTAIG